MARFEIRLLGRFAVVRDGREVPASAFGGRLSRRLVRILASRRGEHVPKDVLAEALWPGGAPADPAANLEVLVSRARRAMGDSSLIVTGPGGYAFADDPSCAVDAEDLRHAVDLALELRRESRPADALGAVAPAIGAWGGEPLSEDLYEEWAAGPRDRLAEAFQTALELGADAALAIGDRGAARSFADRAAARQPLREAAVLLRVRALAAEGDRAAALDAYERYRRALADELGLDPSEEATRVQASVLRGEPVAPASPGPASRAVAVPLPEPAAASLPFVGRDLELEGALDERHRVVVVSGASGAGKSRFLRELAARCEVPVVAASAYPPDRDEPWALGRSVVREALALDALALRELPALAASALLEVAPELGALAELEEGRATRPVRADRESRRAIAIEAGRMVLERVARTGAVLAIDDLQWADATSLRLLAAASRIGSLRLVLAYRTEELRAGDPPHGFLADLRRATTVHGVELGRLPVDAIAALVGDASAAAAIDRETSATPLVVAEAVHAFERRGGLAVDAAGRAHATREIDGDEAREVALEAERAALERRIDRLAASDREALEVLAALDREAEAATIAGVLERSPDRVFGTLDLLAAVALARAGERGWVVAHDSIADAMRMHIEPGRHANLHRRIAEVLAAESAEPSEVAAHLAAAGERAAAVERYTAAAERALSRFANDECLRLLEAVAALDADAASSPSVGRLRAEARARSGDLDGAKSDLREALAAPTADAERAVLLTRLAILESGSEDYEAAGRLVDLALSAAGEDPRLRAEAHAVGSIVDLNLGEHERSASRSKIALELFEANGDARGAAGILDGRAMARFLEGHVREAIDAFDRVARLFQDAGELLRTGTPRSTRGHALVFAARAEEGLADVEEALALERTLGHVEGESYALWHRAEALAALGRPEEAEASAREALAIAERLGHREWTAASLRGLGIALEAGGDVDAAIEIHQRGVAASEGMPLFRTWAAARLAACLTEAGRLDDAASALALATPDRAPLAAYELRLADAALRAARGDADARRFAESAAALAEGGGHVASAERLQSLVRT